MEVAVIGAGVIGCAIASQLARRGDSVWVLERGTRVGLGISSRNSGVIHSGLYAPPQWHKAQWCVRGQGLLYAWAQAKTVPHARTGKLVVACDASEVPALAELHRNATACGAVGVTWQDGHALATRAAGLPRPAAGLWCANTGIVDASALTRSLQSDAERHDATFVLAAELVNASAGPHGWTLETTRGPLEVEVVVNAAGLAAAHVATMLGATDVPPVYPCRGDYFRLRSRQRYSHLVYPVRRRGAAGLGVHLTLDLDGGLRLGPDAEYVASADDLQPAEHKHAAFLAAAQRLLGPLKPEQLHYDSWGIRPKLRGPEDPDERDFCVLAGPPGCFHLLGFESPGLTAALAVAEHIAAVVHGATAFRSAPGSP